MQTITASNARKEFFELIKGATKQHKVFHIHHKTGDVVLLPESEYESLIETLELLSTPGFKESIQRSMQQIASGETIAMEEVFKEE